MKNPLKQMKQVQGAMAVMMYEIYLAGRYDALHTADSAPTLKEFSKNAKNISKHGKELVKEMMLHGKRNDTINDAKKSP